MQTELLFNPSDAISEIQFWTKNYYIGEDGGVVRSIEDGVKSKKTLFNDFGDYIPFFAFLKDYSFCQSQVAALKNFRKKDYLLPSEFRYFGIACNRSYEHSDYLLGLLDLYEYHPDLISRNELMQTLDNVYDAFFINGRPHSWSLSLWPHRIPLADTKDGIYVELFLDAARILNEKRYIQFAHKIAEFFLRITQNGEMVSNVVPSNYFGRIISPIFSSTYQRSHLGVIKYNISWWWSLLMLYRVTSDVCWRTAIESHHRVFKQEMLRFDGAVQVGEYESGTLKKLKVLLVENFPAIDFFVDCAWYLKDNEYLVTAKKIADFWLQYQNPETGLFPMVPGEFIDDIDNNTDIAVALFKLADVSRLDIYRHAALRTVNGIWKFHRDEEQKLYVHQVDIRNGKHLGVGAKIKFVLLFLKLLILVSTNRSPIFDEEMWLLSRDR